MKLYQQVSKCYTRYFVQIAILVLFQLQARTDRETCVHVTAQPNFQAAMIVYQLIAVDTSLLVPTVITR